MKQAWPLKPTVFVTRAEFVPGPVAKFVAGTHDGSALVWSDSWDEPELRFAKQDGNLTDLAVSCDGSHLASCYNVFHDGKAGTGTVVLWNLKTGELLQKATVEKRSIDSVRFSPEGRSLAYTIDASPNGDSTLEIRDVETWTTVESIGFGPGFAQRLVWSGDGKKIAVAGGECVPVGPNGCRTEGRLWLAELSTGNPAELIDTNPFEYFRDADGVGTGDRFVVSTTAAKQFIDVNGQPSRRLAPEIQIRGFKDGAVSATFQLEGTMFLFGVTCWQEGNLIAACDMSRSIHLIDFQSNELLEPIVVDGDED